MQADPFGVDLRAQLGVADAGEVGTVAALERRVVEVEPRGEVARRLTGLDDAPARGAARVGWSVGHGASRVGPWDTSVPARGAAGPLVTRAVGVEERSTASR
jgi:hypothetical protein